MITNSAALLRGNRITRSGATIANRFILDAPTAHSLREKNAGVFVGGCLSVDSIINRLANLAEAPSPVDWIVVTSSHQLSTSIFKEFAYRHDWEQKLEAPLFWESGSLAVVTPEALNQYLHQRNSTRSLEGIIVVDPICQMYRQRFVRCTKKKIIDRPQVIADARAHLANSQELPLFILMSTKPAISVNTATMLSPYCLDTWWFVDGTSLKCGALGCRGALQTIPDQSMCIHDMTISLVSP